ncbi:MAG: DUF541 domain-containing protein [Burkholderiales bacterium]|nr:DUF541 domain-containing protein [Burkholderiales bacterium]
MYHRVHVYASQLSSLVVSCSAKLLRVATAALVILFSFATASASNHVHRPDTEIQFEASASQLVENDSMRAVLFVEAQDNSPSAASSQVTRLANSALRKLRQDNNLRIRTGAYRSWPTQHQGEIISWRARSEIIVESDDIDQVAAALATLTDIMQLASVEFFPSKTLREQVESVLADQAIKAFLAKANRIAKSFGATRFEVSHAKISSPSDGIPPQPVMRAMSADAGARAPEFASGTTRLSVSVAGAILISR